MAGSLEIIKFKNKSGYTQTIYKMNNEFVNLIRPIIKVNYYKFDEIIKNSKEPYMIPYDVFYGLIKDIYDSLELRINMGSIDNVDFPELIEKARECDNKVIAYDEYNTDLIKKFGNKDTIRKIIENEEYINNIVKMASEIKKLTQEYYSLRDLTIAKENVKESLKYFCDNTIINNLENEFNFKLETLNVEEITNVIEKYQKIIYEHWQEYITNIDEFKQDEPFKLICHSTDTTSINGNFYTSIISASLLSEEQLGTYRSGYGFVFSPEKIIGADSKDMYVINSSNNKDDYQQFTKVKKLSGPEKIINDCKDLRIYNNEHNIDKIVYNEVVIDGFEPIAIFCITNGAKNLCVNYQCAKKLQEQYPNLKIIEIDATLCKDKDCISNLKNELISNLLGYTANKETEELYSLFWEQFLIMKQSKNYNEEDIKNLFKKHTNYVSGHVNIDELLSNSTPEEINFVFQHNKYINISKIFNSDDINLKLLRIDNLYYELKDYTNNPELDKYVPGINNFLKMYGKVTLNDDEKQIIKNCNSIDEINAILISKINSIADQKQSEINVGKALQINIISDMNACISEREKIEQNINNYNHAISIIDKSSSYSVCKMDIFDKENEKSVQQAKKSNYEHTKNTIKMNIDNINQQLEKLNKHKILNYFKIKKISKSKLEEENKLENLTSNIELIELAILEIDKQIFELKEEFRSANNIELDKFEASLKKAQEFVSSTNIVSLSEELDEIKARISKLETSIGNLQAELDDKEIDRQQYLIDKIIETNTQDNSR